jgi:hypothetical protein
MLSLISGNVEEAAVAVADAALAAARGAEGKS